MLFHWLRAQLLDMEREDAHGSVTPIEPEREDATFSRRLLEWKRKIEESHSYHYLRNDPHILGFSTITYYDNAAVITIIIYIDVCNVCEAK